MPVRIPPDERRCRYTTSHGKRCRMARLEGEHTLCYFHFTRLQRKHTETDSGLAPDEIVLPGETLDNARTVNVALARTFRLVAEGRLSPRRAAALGYLGQLILATLPHLSRDAAAAPTHPLLGADPDAAIAELARALKQSVASGAAANASGVPPESR